jgi:hypothetical protein
MKREVAVIQPPKWSEIEVTIEGTAPYMQHRFWSKGQMIGGQREGGKSQKKKDARNFESEADKSMYRGPGGECCLPVLAVKAAMVRAASLVGGEMKSTKLAMRIIEEFRDVDEGMPCVKLNGDPVVDIRITRNSGPGRSATPRARMRWDKWTAKLRIRWLENIVGGAGKILSLLETAGECVGIGEGRPDAKSSDGVGLGFGTFRVVAE